MKSVLAILAILAVLAAITAAELSADDEREIANRAADALIVVDRVEAELTADAFEQELAGGPFPPPGALYDPLVYNPTRPLFKNVLASGGLRGRGAARAPAAAAEGGGVRGVLPLVPPTGEEVPP